MTASTVRFYRWLAHWDEWQGRPAHAFVERAERSFCKRAKRPAVAVQQYQGDVRASTFCQPCLRALENALDMQEVRS